MSDKLVSVIITTYNREDLVCRAVDSVLAQIYKNIEIIVVDDCSKDNTEKRLESYFDRIIYIKNNINMGLSSSRNVGIISSSGEFISFLDDDDYLLPDKVSKQVDFLSSHPEVDIVYCGSIMLNGENSQERLSRLRGEIYPEVLLRTPNAIHTLLIKRSCLNSVGFFDENLKFLEDQDLWIRLSKKYVFDFIDEPLVVYCFHGKQMTSSCLSALEGKIALINKYKDDFENNKKILYNSYMRIASYCAFIDNYPLFYVYLKKSLRVYPFGAKAYIHFFISLVSKKIHFSLINKFAFSRIGDAIKF